MSCAGKRALRVSRRRRRPTVSIEKPKGAFQKPNPHTQARSDVGRTTYDEESTFAPHAAAHAPIQFRLLCRRLAPSITGRSTTGLLLLECREFPDCADFCCFAFSSQYFHCTTIPHRKPPNREHWAFRKPPPPPTPRTFGRSVQRMELAVEEALERVRQKEILRKEEEERLKREAKAAKKKGKGGIKSKRAAPKLPT